MEDIDILARLQALEDVVAYNFARYLEIQSDEASEGIKNSFLESVPDLGAGVLSADTLQEIQEQIALAKIRLLENASRSEGRAWTPKALSGWKSQV